MKNIKTRKELIELISEYFNEEDEKKQDVLYDSITNSVVDPQWADYIYWSDEFVTDDEKVNIEGLVDKILSYKPILL